MGLFRRDKGRHEPGETIPESGAEYSPLVAADYPRFDGGGRPIIEFSPDMRATLRLDGVRTDFGSVYRKQASVRICVDFLAENIAHCKLKVYHHAPGVHGRMHDEREEVDHHDPLVLLLANPSGLVSGYEFIRDTVSDIAVFGNAYWVKRTVGNARALVRVMPVFVTGRGGSPVAGPTSYVVDVGGGPVRVRPEEMVHFRMYNPADIRIGTSVLESVQSMLSEESAVSKHRTHYWENAARHEGWIERPKASGRWTRAQRKEFREDWHAAHAGHDNAGKVAVLEDDMKLHQGSFSPKDSEFIAGREWGLDMVATAYHIPLAALSRTDTATFASMKEFHTMVYVDTLGPWMAMLEKAINIQLVPDFGDEHMFVEFNIEEKLQGDFESQAMALRGAGHVPYMSVNDMRKVRNLSRLTDPDFDLPAKPSNYIYESQQPEPGVTPIRQTTAPPAQPANDQQAALEAELAAFMPDPPREELLNGNL